MLYQPQHWKETIKQFVGTLNNLYIQDHHLIKCNTIYNLEKLNSKKLYHMQLCLKYDKPTCRLLLLLLLLLLSLLLLLLLFLP